MNETIKTAECIGEKKKKASKSKNSPSIETIVLPEPIAVTSVNNLSILNKNKSTSKSNNFYNLKYKVNINQTRNKTESQAQVSKKDECNVDLVATETTSFTDECEQNSGKNHRNINKSAIKYFTTLDPSHSKSNSETYWKDSRWDSDNNWERNSQSSSQYNYKNNQHFDKHRRRDRNKYDYYRDGYRNNYNTRGDCGPRPYKYNKYYSYTNLDNKDKRNSYNNYETFKKDIIPTQIDENSTELQENCGSKTTGVEKITKGSQRSREKRNNNFESSTKDFLKSVANTELEPDKTTGVEKITKGSQRSVANTELEPDKTTCAEKITKGSQRSREKRNNNFDSSTKDFLKSVANTELEPDKRTGVEKITKGSQRSVANTELEPDKRTGVEKITKGSQRSFANTKLEPDKTTGVEKITKGSERSSKKRNNNFESSTKDFTKSVASTELEPDRANKKSPNKKELQAFCTKSFQPSNKNPNPIEADNQINQGESELSGKIDENLLGPRISLVPLASLLKESNFFDINNIVQHPEPSAEIQNVVSDNDADAANQKLVDKISKMDKTCIKNIINNPTSKFDTALKVRARKRLHEEIRKQLRSIQIENPDNNRSDIQPDEFIDASNIPQSILDHFKNTFGIDILAEMVKDSHLITGSEEELALTAYTTESTSALNILPLEELPNPNNNRININDSNSMAGVENDNTLKATNEIDKDLSKPDLMQKLKNMEMVNNNKLKYVKSTENLSPHKINSMQSEKENKTRSPTKKIITSKRTEKLQKKSSQNDKTLKSPKNLNQSASLKEIETLTISSSSSSSGSSSDSDSSSSSSSASSTCSSYKRRKRRKRVLETSVIHNFKRLILPTLSTYLRKKYDEKYSKKLSDSLSFIYDVCLNKLLRNSNLGQYEKRILKKNLKTSNNEEALLFLQKNIKELYEQERKKYLNNSNQDTGFENRKKAMLTESSSKSNNNKQENHINNCVSDTNCIADQLKLIVQHITEKCILLKESSQPNCNQTKKITTSQHNENNNKNNPVNVNDKNEKSTEIFNINEEIEENSIKMININAEKNIQSKECTVDGVDSNNIALSANLIEKNCNRTSNRITEITKYKTDSNSLENENSNTGNVISKNNHHIDDNAGNKNISCGKNLLDEENNLQKTTTTTINKSNNKNDVSLKNNINSNKLSDNNIVLKDIEEYNNINDNNVKHNTKKNLNQINNIDFNKNSHTMELDDIIDETSDDEMLESNFNNNNNYNNENCISHKLWKSTIENKILTEEDIDEIHEISVTNIGNKNNNGILNNNIVQQQSLLNILQNNQTSFNNNNCLEKLHQDYIRNKFGDNVLNNLREMDLKLLILHKRKMYHEEMILQLQKSVMEIDLASMQLQNERFLLLNSSISNVNLPTTNLNTLFPFSLSQTIKNEPNSLNDYYSQIMSNSLISSSSNNEDEDPQSSTNRKRSTNEVQTTPEKGPNRKKRCQRDILIDETARNVFSKDDSDQNSTQKELSEAVQLFLINSERTSKKIAKKLQVEGKRLANALKATNKSESVLNKSQDRGHDSNFELNHERTIEEHPAEEIIENNSDIKNGFYFGFKLPITQIRQINEFIIASSEDGVLYKFNWKTKELVDKFTKHKQAIVQFVNTNLFIYTVSLDGYLKQISVENFTTEIQSVNVMEPLQSVDIKWSTVFIGTRSGNVFTYNLKTNKLSESALFVVDGSVLVLKATKEGARKVLILAAKGNQINIRDAVSGLLLRIINVPQNQNIYSILLIDGVLYCGTNKNEVHSYDFLTSNKIASINCGNGAASLSLYRKKYIFVGCYDGYIYVFDKFTNCQLDRFRASGHIITALEIIGQKIITSTKENTLEMMDLPKCVK